MENSNITIRSNVYPLGAKEIRYDHKLIKQIRTRSAFRKLVECLHGPIRDDSDCRKILAKIVEPEILRIYWDEDMACEYSNGEKTYGLMRIEGSVQIVCRCRQTSCKYYRTQFCNPE